MSVQTLTELSSGLFVPYRGTMQGLQPAGTVEVAMQATGAAGGGTVTLHLVASKIEFGFHPILTLTAVASFATVVVAGEVFFQYSAVGNERMQQSVLTLPKTEVDSGGFTMANWLGEELPIPIEPFIDSAVAQASRIVASIQWTTNTDTASYNAAVFALVWDMEALARRADAVMPDVFYGVR